MANNKLDWDDEIFFDNRKNDNKIFLRFLGRIISNWYWFLICGLVGASFGYLFLKHSIPKYKIHAKLLVSDENKGGGLFASSTLSELTDFAGIKNSVDNEVEVLKTDDLLREMILTERSYISYEKIGRLQDVPIYSAPFQVQLLSNPDSILQSKEFLVKSMKEGQLVLSSLDTVFKVKIGQGFFLPQVGRIRIDSVERGLNGGNYGFKISPVRSVVEAFRSSLSVHVTNKNVSTINLTLENQLPKKGEEQLNTLIEKYVELNLHDKNVIADSTLAFINARLYKITEELAGVEDRISGYKKQNQLADISEQGKLLLASSVSYSKELAEVETQLSSIDAVAGYLKNSQNPRVVPSSVIPQDVGFNELIQRYNELVLQRERLLLANTEDNPLVVNITQQIAGVRQDMISNVASTRRQLELVKNSHENSAQNVTSQIKQVPALERGFIDLARLQQIKQAQYVFLQEKWEETAIKRTANVANSKVIDSPKADKHPFSPHRSLVYGFSLLAGLLIPFITFNLRDLLNLKIRGPQDLEDYPHLPVLAMVSHSDDQNQVIVSKTSRSAIAEQFRSLRTNLEFILNGGKCILFTSSMSGEGKSYVALNLAVSLALLDKKVLLMELDLRKPSLSKKLGLASGNGFSHFIVRSEMRPEEIIVKSGVHENVDLIQAGAIPPNPAELLVHLRSIELMKELNKKYDYILMDAPPIGLVTDAQLLARFSDCCLYLVRQDMTHKEQLRIPEDLIKKGKISNIQLILNDIKTHGNYYTNYGYGYGYGYGSYGDFEQKKPWWSLKKFKRRLD